MTVAVTIGEPAGIAGEITLKAWLAGRTGPAFCAIGDPAYYADAARRSGLTIEVRSVHSIADAESHFRQALPVLPLALARVPEPGQPLPENAATVIGAIDRAVALARTGEASAVVTNPIHKAVLYGAGFKHPGHTEYLAYLAGGARPVMMLASPDLRVVPVTVHIALKDVAARLTRDDIVACAEITAEALKRDFGIAEPRLAVAGLNPHGGEGGHLGKEEIETIAPAIATLRAKGLTVMGPAPADTLFHAKARAAADAVICMYHDQALIPLKTIDFDRGVNVTLGLPFVRTSPDHGTAFDIAGKGLANAESLIAAIALAAEMAARRSSLRAA